MFPLALEVDGVDIVATRSRRLYVLRGLLGIFALPILFLLLVGLLAGGLGFDDEPLILIWLALSAASIVWGIALIALSRWLSRRGAVRFDRTRGVVSSGSLQLPFEGLELRVRKLEGMSGWTTIEARHGQRVIAIHDRLQPMHAIEVATHVNYLAELVGAPVQAAPDAAFGAAKKHLIPDNTAAMLCYLPFQGIHLFASLYYLVAARERPFVRFAAKQSLAQLGMTMLALLVFGVGFGIPLALAMDGEKELTPVAIVLIVLLSVSLGVVAIGNIVAHIVACVRAQGGKLWVMPWLRWIVSAPQNDETAR
jgi:uncharacterized membrane protein